MIYFLHLLYQYTVKSDTRLFTQKKYYVLYVVCISYDHLLSVNRLWCLRPTTKCIYKIFNLFHCGCRHNGNGMLMKVCFVEKLNTFVVIINKLCACTFWTRLKKILVENITLHLGVFADFTSEGKIICLNTQKHGRRGCWGRSRTTSSESLHPFPPLRKSMMSNTPLQFYPLCSTDDGWGIPSSARKKTTTTTTTDMTPSPKTTGFKTPLAAP